jgi:nitrous oxide reductase accessory protein NosL
MRRRHPWGVALALLVFVLGSCGGEPESGPGPVAWDRDECEHCRMLLSDRSFATQLRTRDGRLHRFDDVGCALLWAHEHASEEPSEIWVRDMDASGWLDAREARFVEGQRSPMGYGYGARPGAANEGVGLEAARQRILARDDERRSPPR